jgi:hypothetical protein
MGGLYANKPRYLAYGPESLHNLNERIGISAGLDIATRAQNVLSAPAFSFGVFLKN